MPKIIKDHVQALLKQKLREDGRMFDEYRKPISVEVGVSPKTANGSARVKIGMTDVIAGVKLGADTPYPDSPDQGNLIVMAELSPISNPSFETGPPSIDSIELSRVVDRGIRESQCLDMKKLCIKKGEKVWVVFVDIYPINDDGNLFDAASLAVIAALKDARFPEYDSKTNQVMFDKMTTKKLPLNDTPLGVTVIRIGDAVLVDPSYQEWTSLDARLTVVSLTDGTLCALQKGNEMALSPEDIDAMVSVAVKKAGELRKYLK
jgi:exosome complex component RRP42